MTEFVERVWRVRISPSSSVPGTAVYRDPVRGINLAGSRWSLLLGDSSKTELGQNRPDTLNISYPSLWSNCS